MISIKDSGNNVLVLKSTQDGGGQHITHHNVDTCALPTGASTDAKLQLVLNAILAQASLIQNQPVALASQTAGLALEATQGTGNSTLASILSAVAALTTHAQTQNVAILTPSLALDATLNSLIDRIVFPLVGGLTAVIGTSIVNTTPVELVAASGSEVVTLYGFVIGNDSATATYVQFWNDDNSVIYTVFAPGTSTQYYPIGLINPAQSAAGSAVRVKCLTSGAGVQVTAAYRQA
jgi:hypothetical protein